jgi:hypothetical protein
MVFNWDFSEMFLFFSLSNLIYLGVGNMEDLTLKKWPSGNGAPQNGTMGCPCLTQKTNQVEGSLGIGKLL